MLPCAGSFFLCLMMSQRESLWSDRHTTEQQMTFDRGAEDTQRVCVVHVIHVVQIRAEISQHSIQRI